MNWNALDPIGVSTGSELDELLPPRVLPLHDEVLELCLGPDPGLQTWLDNPLVLLGENSTPVRLV